jgi:hypothetical protein
MKTILVICFIFFSLEEVQTQNFYPLEDIVSYSVMTHYDIRGPQGTYYYGTNYGNIYEVPYIIVDSVKFFKIHYPYGFIPKTFYYNYDQPSQKLYIYENGEVKLAADFNLESNQIDTLAPDGITTVYKSSGIYISFLFGQLRKTISFTADVPLPYFPKVFTYSEGLGLIRVYQGAYSGSSYYSKYNNVLYSAIIDTSIHNYTTAYIDSVSPNKDRVIDTFPFTLKVHKREDNSVFQKSCTVKIKIIRNDTLAAQRSFAVEKSSSTSYINIYPPLIKENDLLQFKVIYVDTSIFLNTIEYPDTGYLNIKVLPLPLSIDDENKNINFSLFQNYPNPFNPTTKIKFTIADFGFTSLKIYDVLGNEVATLVNEVKHPGEYEVEFSVGSFGDGSKLSSGVYFYQLRSGEFIQTNKMILMR